MITIDVKDLLICLVLIALIVLLIILCVVAKNLITTVKELNRVLEDTEVVTNVVQERTTQLDGAVGDLGIAVADVTRAMEGNQSLIGALTNVGKATASVISYLKSDEDEGVL